MEFDIEVMKKEEWIELGVQLKVDRESMVKLIEAQKALEEDWGWYSSELKIPDMDKMLQLSLEFKFEGQSAVRLIEGTQLFFREFF